MKPNKLDTVLRAQLDEAKSPISVIVIFESAKHRDDALGLFKGAVAMPPRSVSVTLPASRIRALAQEESVLAIRPRETAELLG